MTRDESISIRNFMNREKERRGEWIDGGNADCSKGLLGLECNVCVTALLVLYFQMERLHS